MFTHDDVVTLLAAYGWPVYAPIMVAMFWTWIARREVAKLHAQEASDGRDVD